MTDEELAGFGVTRAYPRYGGLAQCSPLTPEEQKYDDTCREIDRLEEEIGAMSAARFTASEMIWFSAFVQKVHMFPNQGQLDRALESLQNLKQTILLRHQ